MQDRQRPAALFLTAILGVVTFLTVTNEGQGTGRLHRRDLDLDLRRRPPPAGSRAEDGLHRSSLTMSNYLLNHLSTGGLIAVVVGVPNATSSPFGGPGHLIGAWRYGTTGALRGGWDLVRISGPDLEPPDVTPIFDQPRLFCRQVTPTVRPSPRRPSVSPTRVR